MCNVTYCVYYWQRVTFPMLINDAYLSYWLKLAANTSHTHGAVLKALSSTSAPAKNRCPQRRN